MTASSSKYQPKLPIQASSHQKETISRIEFEKLIFPWIVQHWEAREYGIDATITITSPQTGIKDRLVTPKKFDVQIKASAKKPLKSGDRSIRVDIEKINIWSNSMLPTMLCYFDVNTEEYFFEWIDHDYIINLNNKNPDWHGQQKVTVRLREKINENISEIEKYVYKFKKPIIPILPPGIYFQFDTEIKKRLDTIASLSEEFDDNFLLDNLSKLKKDLIRSIYSIAIVGKSRVGKSTLINAFLEKDISPIGELPTTGIPISMVPGQKEECEVYFSNEKKKIGKANSQFLSEYASQKSNPKNKKNVKQIVVKIKNQTLEKGICLYDIPGLDDSNKQIRELSSNVLFNVNAIIYVITAASMVHGEFNFDQTMREDLEQLCLKKERVFLVVNKVDTLTTKQLKTLKNYLESKLDEFNISAKLPCKPIYLSAKNSFEKKDLGSDKVRDLRKVLWGFLLSNNKTGLHKLIAGLNRMDDGIVQAKSVIETRMSNTKKSGEIRKNINLVKIQLETIHGKVNNRQEEILAKIQDIKDQKVNAIINSLENQMLQIPLEHQLFLKKDIDEYLRGEALNAASDIQQTLENEILRLGNETNKWVKNTLRQHNLTSTGSAQANNNSSNYYSWLIHNHFNHEEGSGFFYVFFDSIYTMSNDIAAFLKQLIIGKAQKRRQDIDKIISKTKTTYQCIFSSIGLQTETQLRTFCSRLIFETTERTNLFLHHLETQLEKIDTPLSNNEIQKFQKYLGELKTHQKDIKSKLLEVEDKTEYFLRFGNSSKIKNESNSLIKAQAPKLITVE